MPRCSPASAPSRTSVRGFVLLCLAFGACSAPEAGPEPVRIVHAARGDTAVVRTEAGSAWGVEATLVPEVEIGALEGDPAYLFGRITSLAVGGDGTIYAVDAQVPELRAYAPDGTFLRTLGRPGEGPGEIKGPDGGLAVLSDGRVLVRDPGNARIQVYARDGAPLQTWSIRGGFNTSNPLFRDTADNVYTQILLDPRADIRDWVVGLVRIGPDGTPGDTLVPPDAGYASAELEARSGDRENQSVSRTGVPFAPSEQWALHPEGWFVHGIGDAYKFTLLRPGSPLIVERASEAAPVTAGEKSEEEARVTRNLRTTQPDWRWSGPSIPDRKPHFRRIHAGRDGRIWVEVALAGVEVEDPTYDPKIPDAVPDRWRDPVAFDLFETDGTYLGRVRAPLGFSSSPLPVFDGDRVWATTRDDLGVQRIVRFRVERGSDGSDG